PPSSNSICRARSEPVSLLSVLIHAGKKPLISFSLSQRLDCLIKFIVIYSQFITCVLIFCIAALVQQQGKYKTGGTPIPMTTVIDITDCYSALFTGKILYMLVLLTWQ